MPDTPSNDGPKKYKSAAAKRFHSADRGSLRHGLKAGQLPKDAKYIEIRLNIFRQKLEDAVLLSRNHVTMTDAALIQTALRWERHAALAQRWLVKAGDTLKAAERLQFSREIARASSERYKALSALKLDAEVNPWDAVDAEASNVKVIEDNNVH